MCFFPASADLSNPYTKTLWNKLFALFVAGVPLTPDLCMVVLVFAF
jgi:hypothetical protein